MTNLRPVVAPSWRAAELRHRLHHLRTKTPLFEGMITQYAAELRSLKGSATTVTKAPDPTKLRVIKIQDGRCRWAVFSDDPTWLPALLSAP